MNEEEDQSIFFRWIVTLLNKIQKNGRRGDFRGKMKLSVFEWFDLGSLQNFEVDAYPCPVNLCDWSSGKMSEVELWQ